MKQNREVQPEKERKKKVRFIGITGGVGAGKSAILAYFSQMEKTKVMLADEIAHDLMKPGTSCYDRLKCCFVEEDIYLPDGNFDKGKMAQVIFSNQQKREQLNAIVHPAVKEYVIQTAKQEREKGELDLLILEAALLIEEHYDEICEELWYIYTSEENREKRLMESRGYSKEKVHQIFDSQLKEEDYRKHCNVVIDNNGSYEDACHQIDEKLYRLR